MNVLFISRKFPPSVGGMEKFAFELSSNLENIVRLKKVVYGGSNKWLFFVLPWIFFRSFMVLICKQIQIIHIQDGLLSPMGLLLAKVFNKPYVVIIHGLDVTYRNSIYQFIIRHSLRGADKIICISKAAKEEVIKRGIDRQKVQVITLGIEERYKSISKKHASSVLSSQLGINVKKKKVLITVGRLVERKGVDWFIAEVLPLIDRKDVVYLVVGDGIKKEEIKTRIKTSNQNNVYLTGRVSDDQLEALYCVADVFVMPNITVKDDIEGFGLVLLEASLRQIPVVASAIEGILDATVNGKNAVHVPEKNEKIMSVAITKILDNPRSAINFGVQSREFTLHNYSWETIVKNGYFRTYQKVIKKQR